MYNDNPILSNEDYLLISQQYQKAKVYQRTESLGRLLNVIALGKQFCFAPPTQLNKKLTLAVKQTGAVINTVLDNLSTAFNVEKDKIYEIRQVNIFSFIKSLSEACKLSLEVYLHEEKEYIKQICLSNIKLLNEEIVKLLALLEISEVRTFKFM